MESITRNGYNLLGMSRLAFRQLLRHGVISLILVIEILLSVIMFAQLYVFLLNYLDNVKATKEFPKDAYVLSLFDYYDLNYVMQKAESDPDVTEAGMVVTTTCLSNGQFYHFAAYPPAIISHYQPSLKEGEWLSENTLTADGNIPCIISGTFGERIGDKLYLSVNGYALSAEVIGVLSRPSQILYPTGSASASIFSIDMITTQDPSIIFPMDAIRPLCNQIRDMQGNVGKSIFLFTEPECNLELSPLKEYGELTTMNSLSEVFRQKSYDMIITGAVFAVVFFLLSATCMLSNYVTQSEQNMRVYTIYYLLGMKWEKCLTIEILRVCILLLLTISLCFGAGKLGLLMLEWMTPQRRILFFLLTSVVVLMMFIGIGARYFLKLKHADLSVLLKEIHRGE